VRRQNYVIFAVEIDGVQLPGSGGSDVSVITKAEEGQHFVSIDGKRTYINLFGSNTEQGGVTPTRVQQGGHATPHNSASASAIGAGQVFDVGYMTITTNKSVGLNTW
jgi:hypothetical protein